MLSIGARNPYLQTVGVKKQKQVQKTQTHNSAVTRSIPKSTGASSKSVSQSMALLEALAMNNLIGNNNVSPGIKNSALQTLNANVTKSLSQEKGKVSNLSSKLNNTKQQLSEVTSALGSSDDLSQGEKEIYELIASALQSEVQSFQTLLDKAKYAVDQLSSLAYSGVNQVVGESAQSPDLLDMLSRSNSEYSSDASAKLLHMSSESTKAVKKLGGLVQSGKVNLKKTAMKAKDKDPQKTAEGLDNLYRNTNLSKGDRLAVTQVLTSIAVDNPLNGAGKAAASGLENIFKKDSGAVAKNAAVGLRIAAIAGNENATQGLINVAKSPVAGKQKNQEAILQLTKVAKSGAGQSQKATDAITKMAQNPNFSGKVKEQLVDSLGEIAYNGGANGKKALNTLAHIAKDDKSPHQKQAFNNILKQKSNKALGNSEVVKAFSDIAESKRTDPKIKKTATNKLGEAAQFGNQATAQKAQGTLTKVATNPANKAAPLALHHLQKLGSNNISNTNKSELNHHFNKQPDNSKGLFGSRKNQNPFFDNNMFKVKSPLVKAVAF